MITEKYMEVIQKTFVFSVDYTKAFGGVRQDQLMECLKEIIIDEKDIKVISELYWNDSSCAFQLQAVQYQYI